MVLESVTPKMSAMLLVLLPPLLMMTRILSPLQSWKAPSLWRVMSVDILGSDLSVSWKKVGDKSVIHCLTETETDPGY